MNKIIRMWNQNRKKIIIIALVVAFCFLIIQGLNQLAKRQIEEKNKNTVVGNKEEKLPTTSIITGEKVKETTTKTNVSIIETFVEKCNANDIESAYNLLTQECKETLFNTKESFINNYYNIIFKQPRTIKIENYKNSSKTNTYQVTFYEDTLSTGNMSGSNKYTDYITVDNKAEKLNINSLITSSNINKETQQNGIRITVLKQEIYKDYEIYKIEAKNTSENTVILDTRKTSKSIYIVDSKNIKYTAYANELPNSSFNLPKYTSKILEIKFNKKYNSADISKKVVFSDIIENYEQYESQNTDNRTKIEIDL